MKRLGVIAAVLLMAVWLQCGQSWQQRRPSSSLARPLTVARLKTSILASYGSPNTLVEQGKEWKRALLRTMSTAILVGSSWWSPMSASADITAAAKEHIPGKIVVVGAAGRTGKLIVEELKSENYDVLPVYRNLPSSASSDVAIADVTKKDSLLEPLQDAKVVIFAASASKKGGNAEAVDYIGVKNVGEACLQNKVPHYVVISSGAVTKPDSLGYKVTNLFGNIMDFKRKGEVIVENMYNNEAGKDAVKSSYVIVRPGGLSDQPAEGPANVELNQGDTIIGEVSRQDVAQCVSGIAKYFIKHPDDQTVLNNVVFEIYGKKSSYPLQGNFKKPSGREAYGSTYEAMFPQLKSGIDGMESK